VSKETDRLEKEVACLNVRDMPFTLVSRLGFHCDVWRSIGRLVTIEGSKPLDFVLKVSKRLCNWREVAALAKEYRVLRSALDDMVPSSIFVATRVNRAPGAIVFAESCTPWFDLGNPTNEGEALPLLAHQPRLRYQLEHFTRCARRWLDERRMVIDLQGAENLVVDRQGGVRYLDSFHVFFYRDTLDAVDSVDDDFLFRVDQSIRRLEYLEWLVRETIPVSK
jgi:hypothetical protein